MDCMIVTLGLIEFGRRGGLSIDFKLHQQVELVRNTQLNWL